MQAQALLVALVFGCANGSVPPPSGAHPASPSAPEGASTTTTTAVASTTSSAHEGHDHAATVYTCPMHPEITSDKPGQCPKCGMNLVPKK